MERACTPLTMPRTKKRRGKTAKRQRKEEVAILGAAATLRAMVVPSLARCRQELDWRAAVEQLKRHRAEGTTVEGKRFQANRDTVCYAFSCPFDSTFVMVGLVNGYGSKDYIRHHADDEPQICPWAPILTYSFGRSVTFQIKRKAQRAPAPLRQITTEDGLRITMEGVRFQRAYSHGIPREAPTDPNNPYRMSVSVRLCMGFGESYAFRHMALPVIWQLWRDDCDTPDDAIWPFVRSCCADALGLLEAAFCARLKRGHDE